MNDSLIICYFLIFIVSCSGSSANNSEEDSNDITQTLSSHPLVWDFASPESVGMSSSLLEEAFDYAFEDGSFTQAALIIKDGKLIYEKYRGITDNEADILASTSSTNSDQSFYKDLFNQRNKDSLISSWSTAKSFTSFLIGIAIESGHINSINDYASNYIQEWSSDDRSSITVKNLLDMRSGLVPVCYNFSSGELGQCLNSSDSASGGNIVYANDQLTKCINRKLATEGLKYPWYANGANEYVNGSFVYSNCDTMVLGEIIFRATGQDIQTYADYNLFSKLNIEAFWWRDYEAYGQSNGNYLAYCCLDSTASDFAKFGYMLLLGGISDGGTQNYTSYVNSIKNLTSYGLKFWTICSKPSSNSGCDEFVISTIGFDGQYIIIDFERNIVAVRASLYEPVLNLSQERKMKLNPNNLSQSNWAATAPRAMGSSASTNFNPSVFYDLVIKSIN